MKIITGIGRSGTSVLTEYAKQCGLNVGKTKWIPQYDAGNESQEMMEINNHLFKLGAGSGINARVRALNLDVVKDPLFIRNVNIVKTWWSLRKDIEIIYCERPFQDIADSQKRKPQMTCPAYRCFVDEMEQIQTDFLLTCGEIGIPFTILKYPYSSYKVVNKLLGIVNDGEIFKNLMK